MHTSPDKSITLTLTAQCNLHCVYCYEHSKNDSAMSFDIARSILDSEMPECEGQIYIELFGGEPFLAFDNIKRIYDYVNLNWPDKQWIMFATTNGTLIHDEIQDWLKNHKRFICGLSLDGTKEFHDANRSNSFDKIDLAFFAELYPEQTVKMTISDISLPHLADCVIFAHEKGFHVACNLAYGIDWSNQKYVSILERELIKLIEFYLAHPLIKPCSMINESILKVATEKSASRECGAGQHMRAYDTEGVCYACQFFMPISIGDNLAKKSLDIQWHGDSIPESKIDVRCKDCIIKSCCHICYGSNYASTGNIYIHDDNWCKLNKIIFKARAFFRIKQFEKGILSGNEIEQKATLQSAMMILEQLN